MSLNVVALVSGGKDSLYSILHCLDQGHKVVALANLHPKRQDADDLDSFMYQTVGHNTIELIAQAVELPLFRQEIDGFAISTARTYEPSSAHGTSVTRMDEVESMTTLLKTVKTAHPEVNAVSTGAILSDYQRTRVESVALRLGLTPLSYLWQFPFLPPYQEAILLADMASVGQDSRIIKVASGGLDQSFLWKNVADMGVIGRLERSADRFGTIGDGSIIGEGGEYETITLDGPSPLWKHAIKVDESDRSVESGDAGTAVLSIRSGALVKKDSLLDPINSNSVRQPATFDDQFQNIHGALASNAGIAGSAAEQHHAFQPPRRLATLQSCHRTVNGWSILANLTASGNDATQQTKTIMQDLTTKRAVKTDSIVHTTILLRHMDDFLAINATYSSYFTEPNPPSRVTVACGDALPQETLVSISFICVNDTKPHTRHGLHVQSHSYWAPANIGPYSQAITLKSSNDETPDPSSSLVHLAGQIPLVPASMTMYQAKNQQLTALGSLILSLQHLWRVAAIMDIKKFLGAVAFLGRSSRDYDAAIYVAAASETWKLIHTEESQVSDGSEAEDEDEVDVWDMKNNINRGSRADTTRSTFRDPVAKGNVPPLFFAEVETLPRNAPIEWSSIGSSEGGVEFKVVETDGTGVSHTQIFSSGKAGRRLQAGWIPVPTVEDMENVTASFAVAENAVFTVYTTFTLPEILLDKLQPQIVPCFRVFDSNAAQLTAVISYIIY